jgi:hypothetical protein
MRRALCLGLVAVVAVACPSSAAARPVAVLVSGAGASGDRGSFDLQGSNGYSISVQAARNAVTLTAAARNGGFASYRVPGRVSGNRIVARFGSQGRIDVAFRQTEGYRLHKPPKRCEGKTRITRFGAYVGTIAFHGEHGFTEIDAKRAGGVSRFEPRWKCKKRHRHRMSKPKHESVEEGEQTMLQAGADGPRVIFFNASVGFGLRPAETLFFSAAAETRGRMSISRAAYGEGAPGTFAFDEGLTSATVRPPKPFSGSATFAHGPHNSSRWTGNLSVTLPGLPHLSLSGKRFDVSLQQAPFFRPQALGFR